MTAGASRITYDEAHLQVDAIAHLLQSRYGCKKGDGIGIGIDTGYRANKAHFH